jgi:hypothetical protein
MSVEHIPAEAAALRSGFAESEKLPSRYWTFCQEKSDESQKLRACLRWPLPTSFVRQRLAEDRSRVRVIAGDAATFAI